VKTFIIEIVVPAISEDATADMLRSTVNTYFMHRNIKYPPDRRFDWGMATMDVYEHEMVVTPMENILNDNNDRQ
jgi:hypothetical protein